MIAYDYDLFVIGAGSGGVRGARVAAQTGAKVGLAEEYRYGGTCVIRGCVPKKLFVYASHFQENFEDAAGFGWTVSPATFDWKTLIANKDVEIDRLENIYRSVLDNNGVDHFDTRAVLEDAHTILLVNEGRTVTAEKILIATGGYPFRPEEVPGVLDHAITSNEAFHLDNLPKRTIVVGGGYIAVEFAGIFNGMGSQVAQVYRGPEILRGFDDDVRVTLHEAMIKRGIDIHVNTDVASVEKTADGLLVHMTDGSNIPADVLMYATGRKPNTHGLGLERAGVEFNEKHAIKVDEYSHSTADNIWAVGDVTDRVNLTPVAIHEAMCFVETAFKDNPTAPDHDLIPTAVFSQPEIGTIGMSEHQARETFANLDIWRAKFRPLKHILPGRDEKMLMKMIVDADSGRIIGLHILGDNAGEMAQTLGIAIKMGATKANFDATMAVHPTASEELVTLGEPSEQVRNGETVKEAAE